MGFKSVQNDNLMKEGEYEVVCKDARITQTKTSGMDCIAFDFVVRSDVEQDYQRKHIFKNFYQEDNGEYPVEKIGRYAASMGIPNGKEFELDDLIGRNLILVIKHFTGNDGVERECIFYTKPTQNQGVVYEFKEENIAEDDDIPF
jgi:Protein of unknown function (DUF669).